MWIKRWVVLFLMLGVASFSHAAQDDAKPPAWQVEGFWAALNDENLQVMVAAIQYPYPHRREEYDFLATDRAELFAALGERAKNLGSRLTELLRDSDSEVRQAAVKALGMLGEYAKDQAPRLGELLRDQNPYVRQAAIRALGSLGITAKELVPLLRDLLRDPASDVREAAAEALGGLGALAQDQAPRLGELLRDPDSDVRQTAAWALGKLVLHPT